MVVALILAFEDKSLRRICEDEETAIRELGADVAETLKRRLADLRAAATINDIPTDQPYELDGTPDRSMAMNLCEGYRILFSANHVDIPELNSGKVDWSVVSRVKILEIERVNG